MKRKVTIGIAAYNEENNILNTLKSVESSLVKINNLSSYILVCVNGCTDKTKEIVEKYAKKSNVYVKVIESKRGKLKAHKKIIEESKEGYILFLDADVIVSTDTLKKLINELDKRPLIQVVSAYPYTKDPKNAKLYQRILYPLLNLKRIYPQIEMAREDVKNYHPFASNSYELKSRVYFHGRCFIIRNKKVYHFPKQGTGIRGDDTYLSFYILKNYAPGSIRVLFDAPVYSNPNLSVRGYLREWLRIRKDVDLIYQNYRSFEPLRKITSMKLNWRFVLRELPFRFKLYGFFYYFLKKFETIVYNLKRKSIFIDNIWQYENKNSYT